MNFDLQRAFVALDRCVDERQRARRYGDGNGEPEAARSLRSIVGAVADSLADRLDVIEKRELLKPLLERGVDQPPRSASQASTDHPATNHASLTHSEDLPGRWASSSYPVASSASPMDAYPAARSATATARPTPPTVKASYPTQLSQNVLSLADEAMKRCGYVCHPYGEGAAPRPTYSYPHTLFEAHQHALAVCDGSESPPSPPLPAEPSPRHVVAAAGTMTPTPQPDSPVQASKATVGVPAPPTTPTHQPSPSPPPQAGQEACPVISPHVVDAGPSPAAPSSEPLVHASNTPPPFVAATARAAASASTAPLRADASPQAVAMSHAAAQTLPTAATPPPRDMASSSQAPHVRARSDLQQDIDYVLSLQHVPLNADSLDRLLGIASQRVKAAPGRSPLRRSTTHTSTSTDAQPPGPVQKLFRVQARQPASASEALSQTVKYVGRLRFGAAETPLRRSASKGRSSSVPHNPSTSTVRAQTKLTPVSARAAPRSSGRKKKKRTGAAAGTPMRGAFGADPSALTATGLHSGTPTLHSRREASASPREMHGSPNAVCYGW